MDGVFHFAIDPKLLALDQNRENNNLDLNKGSVGQDRPAQYVGEWQQTQSHANRTGLYTVPRPDSEPSEYDTNTMTEPISNDWPSFDDDTAMYTEDELEPQALASSPINSSEKGNLLEDPTFQGFLDTARGTPQAPSSNVKNGPQSLNAKGNGPLTLDHPVVEGYLELVPHLQHIIEYLVDAQWYKKSRQEPPGEQLPKELGLKRRQSSSTPMSLFGEFFRAKQPYDCLLCPEGSPKHKHRRTLERALGHARDHFNFKPIQANQKTYTNLNTKNDQERRAKKPARFCIPCGEKITVQNCQRHAQSKAHKRRLEGRPLKNKDIWSETQ